MSLTITSNLNYDEALGFNSTDVDSDTDSNVASLTVDLSSAISAQQTALSWTYYSAPTNFPQYAEVSNFVTSDQSVTSYFLTSDGSGTPFSKVTGVATDLYVGSDQVSLYATNDANVVVGRIGGANGNVVLTIALHGDPANPELGVAVYAPLVHADGSKVDDGDVLNLDGHLFLGSNFSTVEEHDFDSFAGVPSGSDAFAMILPDTVNDLQLIATGFTGTTEQKITISQDANAGSIGGGGSGQHVASGNSLRVDFVSGGDFSKADTSSEDNNLANISYVQHQEAVKASFQIVQVNPGTAGTTTSLNVFAYDGVGNYQGASFATNASANEGTIVPIDPSNVVVLDAQGHAATGVTISAVGGGGVHITGLQLNYTVQFSTPGDEFDRFTITNTQPAHGSGSNVTFDVGHIHVTTETTGSGTEYTNIGDNMVFEDGGPSISATGTPPSLTVDETALGTDDSHSFVGVFTSSYGADGAGSIGYALGVKSAGVNSGLVDTATGHGIFLYVDGSGNVVGRVGLDASTADPNGSIDFTISVASDGTVTLDQAHAIVHSDPNATDESNNMSAADLVTLTATIHDSDTDSASATANIGTSFHFLDDEPSALAPNPGNSLTVGNTTSSGQPYSYTATDSFTTYNAGNDGVGSFTILGPADTAGDYTWAYGSGGTDQTTIIESYKGSQLFSLALDSSTGSYTMTMLGTLPFSQINLDSTHIKAGGPIGSIDVGTINDGGDYVQISGTANNGSSVGQVNASNGNVGVDNGNLDGGEALIFSLFSPTNSLIPIYGLDMGTKTAQGATYHLYGVLDSDHATVVDLGVQSLAKGGTIHYSGNVLLDSIIVQETAGNAVKIGLAGVHLLIPPVDAGFHFTAQLADGDGDTVSAPFNVFIDGNNDGAVDTAHVLFPA